MPPKSLFPAAYFFATALASKTYECMALRACSIAQAKKEVSNVAEALNVFDWNKTTEGYDFWLGVYAKVVGPYNWNPQIKTPVIYSKLPQENRPSNASQEEPYQEEPDPRNLKSVFNTEKKIIGYKSPYDLFKGRIKAGAIFSEYSSQKLVMYNKAWMTSGVATEIVKTWEPVYQPDEVVITVGRPEVNVTISSSARIEAKGQLVGWGIIEEIKNEMVLKHHQIAGWPVSYPEVVIGCSRFSRADIDKIWETFCKLNPNRTYETNRG